MWALCKQPEVPLKIKSSNYCPQDQRPINPNLHGPSRLAFLSTIWVWLWHWAVTCSWALLMWVGCGDLPLTLTLAYPIRRLGTAMSTWRRACLQVGDIVEAVWYCWSCCRGAHCSVCGLMVGFQRSIKFSLNMGSIRNRIVLMWVCPGPFLPAQLQVHQLLATPL